jgi:hypothetical protein
MPVMLAALHVYPVKGCRGLAPAAAWAVARGLEGDRRWMIVDGAGRFVSQRTRPRLAVVAPEAAAGALVLRAPEREPLVVPLVADGGPAGEGAAGPVTVWYDTVAARDAGAAAAAWFEALLGEPARLVFMPDDTRRAVDPAYAAPGDIVSFADGFPWLLISAASLADLNARLPRPLPMTRFRPNLVVSGCAPYAEDGWRTLRIGEAVFRVVKPCARCLVTTVDQETGEPDGPEPLRTLAGYRRIGDGIMFGQNLLAERGGELRIGATVEIVD